MTRARQEIKPLPLERGVEVKVRRRKGWFTLRSETATNEGWWAVNQYGWVQPIRTADITATRDRSET